MDTWNTPAETPARKGMPTWGKVALGCGIAALLGLGACVVGGVYVFKKSKRVISEMTREPMRELAALVEQAATPESLKAFHAAHPELAKRYPDASVFVEGLKDLPARVGPIPTEIGDFMALMKERRFEVQPRSVHGVKALTLKYRNPGKATIVGEWEGGKLVDLRVE